MKTKLLSLKEILNVPVNPTGFEFKNYITDQENVIENLLIDGNSYNFIAGMNSGKTYGLLKIAHQKSIKMVMLMPLQMIVIQKAKDLLNHEGIKIDKIHGATCKNEKDGTSEWEINKFIQNNSVIACVYDSLWKLLGNENFNPSQYVLCIDEAHNLVTQYGYRYKAINLSFMH